MCALRRLLGTGLRAKAARTAHLMAVPQDSSEEMISRFRKRLPKADLEFVQADLFDWNPEHRLDFIFFASCLSHNPT
jgi:trans-aconitate methyltransferase